VKEVGLDAWNVEARWRFAEASARNTFVKKPTNPKVIPMTEPATSIHCTVWPSQRSRP
jgi:hypothetical protein